MKTRNQINSSKAAAGSKATNQADNNSFNNETVANLSSTSSPRLRDRRSSAMETKSSNAPTAATTVPTTTARNQSPSLSAGAKRLSTGPTRVLPKRSCGRHNSLLADNQPNLSAISNKMKSLLHFKNKPPVQPSNDTHKQISIPPVQDVGCLKGTSTSDKSAAINFANDVPSTSSTSLPNNKHSDAFDITSMNSSDKLSRCKQLVCISLPDNGIMDKSSDPIQSDHGRRSDHGKDLSIKPANLISHKKTFNILIGVTGSVATIKLAELTNQIKSKFPSNYISKSDGTNVEANININIVMTKNSSHFAPKDELIGQLNDSNIKIYDDTDEWQLWKKINDPVLHIELRKWADLFLLAPLDANTLAKLANGICDNLLTCVVRAWDVTKPLIYCPAMNVHMYNHPITREHLCKLQSFGYFRVDCVEKRLACGDFGIGGMASVESISNKVIDVLIHPLTRKLSLTRPLLNQQPTYPIISMTGDQRQSDPKFSPSISNQILNRFRTNNQITVHQVPYIIRASSNQVSGNRVIGVGSLLKKQETANDARTNKDCQIANNNGINKPYISGGSNGKHHMNGVTSIQNLKAIALDTVNDETSAEEEDVEFDFDPSRLLEQSMVTGDSVTILNHDQAFESSTLSNPTDHSFEGGSLFEQSGSAPKIDCLTPLFNTSKFLALCHNKERGCFTCTICKHDYKNRKSMARHLKEQHVQGNIYQCKPCGVSYKRREKLVKHIKDRHQNI